MRTYYRFALSLVSMIAFLAPASGCSSDDTAPARETAGQGGDFAGGTGGSLGAGGVPSDSGTGIGQEASTSGPDTPESVCHEAVRAQCQRRVDCGSSASLSCFGYANLCPEYYFGPGSTRTMEAVRACIPRIKQMTCTDIEVSALPSCLVSGERMSGTSCAYGSQCASTYCEGGSQQCGKCSGVAQIGETCGAAQCTSDAFCHPNTSKCESIASIIHGAEGAKCDTKASPVLGCAGDLICMATSGAIGATCQRLPSEGNSCTGLGGVPCVPGTVCVRNADSGGGNCLSLAACGGAPCDASSYCNYSLTTPACVPRGAENQPCNLTSDTGVIPCVSGTECTPTSAGGSRGLCLKPGSIRSLTCSDTMPCPVPLHCNGGHCGPLDPTTCN